MNNIEWRVPTRDELMSILKTRKDEYIGACSTEFYLSHATKYWSSTTNLSGSSDACSVYLNSGNDYWHIKGREACVRCIRVVNDVFEFHPETKTLNWDQAMEHARNLNDDVIEVLSIEVTLVDTVTKRVVILDPQVGSVTVANFEYSSDRNVEKQIEEQLDINLLNKEWMEAVTLDIQL